jgi:hypothetical protein
LGGFVIKVNCGQPVLGRVDNAMCGGVKTKAKPTPEGRERETD